MFEELVARVRYHIKKANFMGLKEIESTLLLGESADAIEELQAAEKKYLANISALETENQHLKRERAWIPVTERLPERDNDGYYVLVYEDGDIMLASYSGGEWYLRDMYEIIELKPTHWMPLPTPPKEE